MFEIQKQAISSMKHGFTRVGGLNSLGKPWELEMPTVMISHAEWLLIFVGQLSGVVLSGRTMFLVELM